jgi:hypothetical protein
VFQLAPAEAAKLTSAARPADVDRLRSINPKMQIVVRCYGGVFWAPENKTR